VGEAEFVRADKLVEKMVLEFAGVYGLYNNDVLSYEDVLDYIDSNAIIRDLFVRYITENIKDKFEKFNLSDLVDINGYFNPFYESIDELIDGFMDWLKSTFKGD